MSERNPHEPEHPPTTADAYAPPSGGTKRFLVPVVVLVTLAVIVFVVAIVLG